MEKQRQNHQDTISLLRKAAYKQRKFLIVFAAFAVLGAAFVFQSKAATFSTALEVENGTKTGNQGPGLTTGASNNQSVKFGATAGGGGGADEGTTAAATFGWGTPAAESNFNDMSGWGTYDQPGGQHGNRSAGQISIQNGTVVIQGASGGKTGGMAWNVSKFQGRWEARMKAAGSPSCWRPLLLLWPSAEDWPVGGEVDYAEGSENNWSSVNFFLHYSSSNDQTSGNVKVDLSQWNNFAVEWTGSHIRGYLNGKQWFEDTNTGHLPPRAMHATIQLDSSPSCNGNTQEIVDWYRYYNP